ncbi:hypothetical protein J6590_086485 [Homalodisca vitripennis]|nr:hypothetical protein J6590_086485 [Homalodisca vitripennis]
MSVSRPLERKIQVAVDVCGLPQADEVRLQKAQRAAQDATKESRIAKRRKKLEEEEGASSQYCPATHHRFPVIPEKLTPHVCVWGRSPPRAEGE